MKGCFQLLQLVHDAEADFVMMGVVSVVWVGKEHCVLMVVFLCVVPFLVVVGLRVSELADLL